MFVKHLQEYLDKFTDGKKGNAVSNATIYMQVGGHLEEIRRIEVQESNIIGQQSVRVVLKPADSKVIIAPTNPEQKALVTLKPERKLYAKVKKFKYIVESESVFEVNKRLASYLSEDTRDSEIVSIVKAPFEDFLHPELTPKYYKL